MMADPNAAIIDVREPSELERVRARAVYECFCVCVCVVVGGGRGAVACTRSCVGPRSSGCCAGGGGSAFSLLRWEDP